MAPSARKWAQIPEIVIIIISKGNQGLRGAPASKGPPKKNFEKKKILKFFSDPFWGPAAFSSYYILVIMFFSAHAQKKFS